MKVEIVTKKDISDIELGGYADRSVGLRVKEDEKNENRLTIKKIKPKSLAQRSHLVAEGDVILSVNGLEASGREDEISRILQQREDKQTLHIRLEYRIRETSISHRGVYLKRWMTTKLKKDDDSFGFVLRKKDGDHVLTSEYPIISNIRCGGAAQKDGRMREGDRLTKVDDINLSWLSLADISDILVERSEASFTFEYNVRIADSESSEREIEVDVPETNFGIVCGSYLGHFQQIFVEEIRQGSLAERCGAFSEGDVILSINGIDSKLLTADKANSLLNYSRRKPKRISSKSSRRELFGADSDCNCTTNSRVTSRVNSVISSIIRNTDYKHVNTPASPNSSFFDDDDDSPRSLRRKQLLDIIKNFQITVKHVVSLKKDLSVLTQKAFSDKQKAAIADHCTACDQAQHGVQLCLTCLSSMNVSCIKSLDSMSRTAASFVCGSVADGDDVSYDVRSFAPPNCERDEIRADTARILTEDLRKYVRDEADVRNPLEELSRKLEGANIGCRECVNDVLGICLMVRQLTLLISLGDHNKDFCALIQKLLEALKDAELSCSCAHQDAPSEDSSFVDSENAYSLLLSPSSSGKDTSNDDILKREKEESCNDAKCEIKERHDSLESSPLIVNPNIDSYYRLVDAESLLESESSKKSNEGVPSVYVNVEDILCRNSEDPGSGQTIRDSKDGRATSAKICSVFDSAIGPTCVSHDRLVKNNTPVDAVPGSSQNEQQAKRTKSKLDSKPSCSQRNGSKRNMGEEMESKASRRPTPPKETKIEELSKVLKTHSEIMLVKLTNAGSGFGIVLGFSSPNFGSSLTTPIITAVKPKSPAQKAGILQKNDRVLAINHRSILGIPLKELEALKRKVFSADTIILTIEFDVIEPELKFGIFDVTLGTKLKTGLLFESMKRGRPMIVNGIVKGSAAHRSGQLHPKDKILHFKYVRSEEFDAMSCNYDRIDTVQVTVKREPEQVTDRTPVDIDKARLDPSVATAISEASSESFVVRRTIARSLEGSGALVLDQEVTLFRDPKTWDFGFLVGEDSRTGWAYIKDLRPGSPAQASGILKKYDRIVKVNGVMVNAEEDSTAMALLTQANDKVDLLIRRMYHEQMNGTAI